MCRDGGLKAKIMFSAPPPEEKVPVWMTKGRALIGICEPRGLLSAVPVVHVGGRAWSYGWSVYTCRCMHE